VFVTCRSSTRPGPGGRALLVGCVWAQAMAQGVIFGAVLAPAAWAQPAASAAGGIYTCIDDRGRRLTSDRPIPDCTAKEQRVLNRDGSLKKMYPPTLTADERAEADARERKAVEARAAQNEAVRRDRNLLLRYKTEEAHAKARGAALDTVRAAMRVTELRLADLARERKPLMSEAEFYAGRTIPPKLKTQIDANDATVDAQRAAGQTQQAELERINRLFDAELDRLRRLWAGAQPGSLGPIAVPQAVMPAAGTTSSATTAKP
jgi:Domain of unknown function (DUF4124)